jgi:hypothetical protein
MLPHNKLVNKLTPAWKATSPGGIRKKLIKIPFNGQINDNLRAMGTKRVPVLSNKMFGRKLSTNIANMSNMGNTSSFVFGIGNKPKNSNPTPDRFTTEPANNPYSPVSSDEARMQRLRLQQELQDLKRERLSEGKELQSLRERDLTRKRIAATRQSYRAYVLDTSKETRGWLREGKNIAGLFTP